MDYNTNWYTSIAEAMQKIPAGSAQRFATIFERGDLTVELFAPRDQDKQPPHARDEIYIVYQGRGTFVMDDQSHPFSPGDFLFVPAGVPHHFADISEDLFVWAIFFGPEGGQKRAGKSLRSEKKWDHPKKGR